MIALHSYDSSELNFRKNLETAVQLAGQYNKLVVMEEFGSTSNKQTLLSMVATVCNGLGIPWMPWEVMKPGATSDFEFWIDDVLTWNALSKNAAIALAGIENSPLLSLGANCYRDSSCASGCCSNTGTFDGYYHCSQNCG